MHCFIIICRITWFKLWLFRGSKWIYYIYLHSNKANV